jgi:Transposase zinc-ribbon domain
MMSIVLEPYFWDERAAHAKLEEIVWPDGPVCRRCGATDRIGAVTGKGARAGLKFCCRCRKQFRATIGTMFEGSHVPLHKWFQASFLLNAAQGAVTAHQLHRRLEVTNKTALGIVRRLAAVIANAGGNPLAGGLDRPSQTTTLGRRQRTLRQGSAWAPSAVGWEELPWMKFPRQPTRQFLRFADTVRQLGCPEDEVGFERLLAAIGAPAAKCAPDTEDSPSSAARMRRLAGPANRDLEHAAA